MVPVTDADRANPADPATQRELAPRANLTTAENPWPVRLLSAKIGEYVDRMSQVWVEGQVVQLNRRPGAGMTFLTLRDTDADMSLNVAVFARVLDRITASGGVDLAAGARVVVRAKPTFWAKRGSLQLQADDIRPVGVGNLLARIEQLRRVLAAEGLFDAGRKRPLPFLPRRELDAVEDVDVIVVARGGGAVEDLLPFSDEGLVRTAAACLTPLVSAIGHETDCPLLDLVADYRASTPTDAARRIVPDLAEETAGLDSARERIRAALTSRLDAEQRSLDEVRARPHATGARTHAGACRGGPTRRAGPAHGPVPARCAGPRLRDPAAARRRGGHELRTAEQG